MKLKVIDFLGQIDNETRYLLGHGDSIEYIVQKDSAGDLTAYRYPGACVSSHEWEAIKSAISRV